MFCLPCFTFPVLRSRGYYHRLHTISAIVRRQITYRRERWDTPDGDFVDVDFLDAPGGEGAVGSANFASNSEDDSAPFAVLTHGLESTSTAPLTARMALA